MELPDFIRTEWKDKGNLEIQFLNSCSINGAPGSFSSQTNSITDCIDEQSNCFCDESDLLNNSMTPNTFSVQCSFSTLNIWEYEAKNDPHWTTFDLRLHRPTQDLIEVNEEENVEEIHSNCMMTCDLSENEDHSFLNNKNDTNIPSSANLLLTDNLQCLESIDVKRSDDITSKMEYDIKNGSYLTTFDVSQHNQDLIKVNEEKNVEEIHPNSLMISDLSENEGPLFLNDKTCTNLSSAEDHLLTDNLQCLESKDVERNDEIISKMEYEAKKEPHLTTFDLSQHNQDLIEVNEEEKYTNLSCSQNLLIIDNLQCLDSSDMEKRDKITSKMKHKKINISFRSKDPTWHSGGVAWALHYCQNQTVGSNESQNNTKNDNKLIQTSDEKKIGNYIINNVMEFFNIARFYVYQLMRIFDLGSVFRTFYTRIFEGYVSEKDKKICLQINRMEVKALKNLRSYFGHLIKVFPRTPLLCEKDGMLVQKVKLSTKYSNLNRGRRDELIRISNYHPVDNNSSQADLNKHSGLYVTYLSEQDVQYIFDQRWIEKSPFVNNDILQPLPAEEFEYIAKEAYLGGNMMPYHQMVKKVVQEFKLMQFIEDPKYFVDIPEEVPKCVENYWIQRHRLFLRYDDGICLDEESWYSVTPEIIAAHQAQRCACDTVIDAFCGAGGNAIQLAALCNKVIAIDIDPKKIELAQNNARVYGVLDRIEFIVGDFMELAPKLKGDVVFLSPPWGGMSYNKEIAYDIFQLDGSLNGRKIFEAASSISNDIALFLPKSANVFQVAFLAGPHGRVDLEYAHISNKRKGLTVYYSNLADFNYDDDENFEY